MSSVIRAAGVLVMLGAAVAAAADEAAERKMKQRVEALASDGMRGRGAGSPELDRAAELVREWFQAAGLAPGYRGEWFQDVAGPDGEKLRNVVGRIDGRGSEYVVLGAHYDGLGVGAPGTEHEGEVLNGADDNASGVAALVRIADALAERGAYERTVYVVAFTGEETGTLGSKAFAAEPPAPLESVAVMLNLDTIGRVEDEKLIVFGAGTAEELEEILRGVNYAFGFDLALNQEGAGASDHTAFFEKGIPVLHFFSGARLGYHGPGDDAEHLNWAGIVAVADFVTELADYLAATSSPLTFQPVGVERLAGQGGERKKRRVSFGSIPDFSRESGGILLSGVVPGGAAEAAGLAAGDLLVELAGMELDTIYDFQAALAGHEPGDVVAVKYVRGGETHDAEVTLRERK